MKKILICLSFLLLGFTGLKAQLYYGAGAQFNVDASALGIQGKLFYEYDETYRGSGTFTLHFDQVLNWTIDLDGHYKLFEISDSFNFAPLGGLAIIDFNGGTRVGLNLGAFFDFDFDERHVYLEPKLTFRDGSAFIISGGVFF